MKGAFSLNNLMVGTVQPPDRAQKKQCKIGERHKDVATNVSLAATFGGEPAPVQSKGARGRRGPKRMETNTST